MVASCARWGWCSSDGKIQNKTTVVVGESKKRTQSGNVRRFWPVVDRRDLCRVHSDAGGGVDVSRTCLYPCSGQVMGSYSCPTVGSYLLLASQGRHSIKGFSRTHRSDHFCRWTSKVLRRERRSSKCEDQGMDEPVSGFPLIRSSSWPTSPPQAVQDLVLTPASHPGEREWARSGLNMISLRGHMLDGEGEGRALVLRIKLERPWPSNRHNGAPNTCLS